MSVISNLGWRFFIFAASSILLLRIFFARFVGITFYSDQHYDDALMMQYVHFQDHFVNQTAPFNELLIKDIGFPVLLKCSQHLGLQYTDTLTFLYFFAAVLSVVLFYKITKSDKKFIWLLIYTFVLFIPAAFDSWTGTRLYRNAVLTPLYFIVLNMISIIFVECFTNEKINLKIAVIFQIIFGLFFTLTFYIKEDGIWLLACLISVSSICFVKIAIQKKIVYVVILILPLIIFSAGTHLYKSLNEKYFGTYVINARTEGETGKFVNSVYKIKSGERNGSVWATTDAVKKAIEASETLRKNEKLSDEILHSSWQAGDIEKNPIRGDFLGWVILSAIKDSGTCNSVAEQEQLFAQVNREIEAAFENGTLEKDDRIQLVSSMGGRTLKEIFDLRKIIGTEYRMHILLYSYTPGIFYLRSYPPKNEEEAWVTTVASQVTNIDLSKRNKNFQLTSLIAETIFLLYSVVQTILFILAFIGMIWGIIRIFKRKIKIFSSDFFALLISFGNFILSLAYALALAWFIEFIWTEDRYVGTAALKFYSIGLIPMLMSFEIFGAYLFYNFFVNKEKFTVTNFTDCIFKKR